jgi:hypothetical protein
MIGRPRGADNRTLDGPPILHEGPGRGDKYKPNHCDSCAVPAANEKLLTFELRYAGKRAGEWTLCGACFAWRNERPNGDPLHVAEDAA